MIRKAYINDATDKTKIYNKYTDNTINNFTETNFTKEEAEDIIQKGFPWYVLEDRSR